LFALLYVAHPAHAQTAALAGGGAAVCA